MNLTILLGRLVKTPEIKTSASGVKILNFTLAVNKKVKEQDVTSYINCVAFNKTAEIIAQYTQKGSKVIVEGELSSRSYDKDGTKVYVTEIIVNQVTIIEWKEKQEQVNKEPTFQESPRTKALNQHQETIAKRKEEVKELEIPDSEFPF